MLLTGGTGGGGCIWQKLASSQVNVSKDVLHFHAHRSYTCRAWLSLHPLFSTYPLLGACLLTIYTYKRIHLLTRVYGISIVYTEAEYANGLKPGSFSSFLSDLETNLGKNTNALLI